MLLSEDILDELKQYMITNNTYIPVKIIKPLITPIQLQVQTKKVDFFIPEEKDRLFWIFYIIKNGFSDYEYPGNTSFVKEKEEKLDSHVLNQYMLGQVFNLETRLII